MRQSEAEQGRVFAVAPFATRNESDRLLATGLADLLASRLAALPATRVISTNAMLANPKPTDAMGVNLVIEGEFSREGSEYCLLTRIRDVASGREAARPFETRSTNLANLHRESAQTLLAYFPPVRPVADVPSGEEAFTHFLSGRGHLAQRTPESLNRAVVEFVKSLSVDSNAALVRASLASALAQLALAGVNAEKNVRLARANAAIALSTEGALVDALEAEALAGVVEDRKWDRTLTSSAEAIRLAPGSDLAHLARAEGLLHAGLLDLALIETEMVRVSNPRLVERCDVIEATVQLFRGEAAGAAARLEKGSARATPRDRAIHARALAAVGDTKGAVASLASIDTQEARALLANLKNEDIDLSPDSARKSHHALYELGVLAAKRGRVADAERLLIDAARSGFAPISWYENDPELASFRKRPEFANVRREVIAEVRRYQRLVATAAGEQ